MTDKHIEGEARKSIQFVENWHARNANEARQEIQEFPMYTDARLTDEVRSGCGPYSFLNALPGREDPGHVRIGFYFRCDFHWAPPLHGPTTKTDEANYHGGWLPDEASALASLVLGARVRAGEHSRSFGYLNDDPLGSPRASQSAPPTLAQKYRRFVAPCATGTRVLRDLSILPLILELSASQCIALLRAARLYQDALWVVESEPELAWLMLVSALETGALSWHQEELTPVEILETSKSEFAAQLSEKGDGILSLVAEEVAPLFKATAKFQKFCLHFLPDEPSERPYPYLQVKWSKTGWKSILSKVYDYRSRSLHSGIPFPKPMCEPPEVHEPNLAFSEKGTGALAVQTLGAKWEADDLPVSLNTFAQLVQKILLSWWRDMAAGNTATTSR